MELSIFWSVDELGAGVVVGGGRFAVVFPQ